MQGHLIAGALGQTAPPRGAIFMEPMEIDMLELIKQALQISGDGYDDLLSHYVDDCILSMEKLGITVNETDAQIRTAVIAYCGWHVGGNEATPDEYKRIYDEKLAELKMQTGYTTW